MNDIDKQRNMLVVKHNDLIQKASYNLSVVEQRLILFAISKIKPTDKELDRIEMKVSDFCSVCGIKKEHFYQEFKKIIDNLDKKTYWIETEEKVFKMRWFSEAEIIKGQAKIRVLLNTNLKRYLLDLKEHFTEYELYNIIILKSKHSIRLFEIFKSYAYQSHISFNIDEFRKLLYIDTVTYKNFNNLKVKILDKVIEEINEYTELKITYDTETKGKKVIKINFHIERKETFDRYISYRNTIDKLNKESGLIEGQMRLDYLFREDN